MGKVLVYLINYTQFHFKAEEKIMSEMNYTDLEDHKIIHRENQKAKATYLTQYC